MFSIAAGGDTGQAPDKQAHAAVELGAIPPAIIAAASATRDLPIAERLAAVTQPLLGVPYVSDPMGEGEGYDPDPFQRYDGFDCLTFVEEALALALAGDPVHSAQVRGSLRYGGREPSYAHRDHFMELQWIPDAVRNGWIRETTADYGEVERHSAVVTDATWRGWGRRSRFHLQDAELPTGEMSLNVLPLERAIEIAEQIRPGTLLFSVRVERPGVPIWITHTGIVIAGEKVTIRHAANFQSGRMVRDQSLRWYLEHTREYSNWPTAGVALFEPVEAGPRRSLVAPTVR